jgi:hypothetical protein
MLVTAVICVAVAAVVWPLARNDSKSAGGSAAANGGDLQIARQLNLVKADLPAGWKVDNSGGGPLSGFLNPNAGSASLTPQETKQAAAIAHEFEQCMGITAAHDRVFGSAGATPTAQSSSAAYIAPANTGAEVGSTVQIFGSAAPVAADVAQVSVPKYPTCFGTAIGKLFAEGSQQSGGSGVQVGNPSVQPIALPQTPGSETVGVDVTIPVTSAAHTITIEIGVVFVGGGRAEVSLFTYSALSGFSPSLVADLSTALAGHVHAEGAGTGA